MLGKEKRVRNTLIEQSQNVKKDAQKMLEKIVQVLNQGPPHLYTQALTTTVSCSLHLISTI